MILSRKELLMSYIINCPALFNDPVLLTSKERLNPSIVFQEIFRDHNLFEFKDFLLDVLETCFTSDRYPFCKPEKRADFFIYKICIEKCLEAANIMSTSHKLDFS